MARVAQGSGQVRGGGQRQAGLCNNFFELGRVAADEDRADADEEVLGRRAVVEGLAPEAHERLERRLPAEAVDRDVDPQRRPQRQVLVRPCDRRVLPRHLEGRAGARGGVGPSHRDAVGGTRGVRGKAQHASVEGVGHVDVAATVHGHAIWVIETGRGT